MDSKKYNIFDPQLSDYYEENITLEEVKEHLIRFEEQAMLEGAYETREEFEQALDEVDNCKTAKEVGEILFLFDYCLEEV